MNPDKPRKQPRTFVAAKTGYRSDRSSTGSRGSGTSGEGSRDRSEHRTQKSFYFINSEYKANRKSQDQSGAPRTPLSSTTFGGPSTSRGPITSRASELETSPRSRRLASRPKVVPKYNDEQQRNLPAYRLFPNNDGKSPFMEAVRGKEEPEDKKPYSTVVGSKPYGPKPYGPKPYGPKPSGSKKN